jgi:hypothetical protein
VAALSNRHTLPVLAALDDATVSREYRVRSYLAVNCANCHQPGGSAIGFWDARLAAPLRQSGVINGPLQMTLGHPDNRVVKPGSIEESVLYSRIAKLGSFHMPPLATHVLNQAAIELVRDWIIEDLPAQLTYAEWQTKYFGETNAPAAARHADPDDDGTPNDLEFLLGQHPLDRGQAWSMGIQLDTNLVEITFPQIANRRFQVQFSEDLGKVRGWQALEVSDNRPFVSASNRVGVVRDPLGGHPSSRYYRVRVEEP